MVGTKNKYPRDFYILILSSVTIFLAFESSRPILPLFITESGATLVELGLIIGTASLAKIAMKIPLGALADRVNGRAIIIGASLAQSLCQFLYALSPPIAWLYPIQVLQAISVSPLVPLGMRMTQDFTPRGKTGETLGTFLTSYGIAITLGPFVCSFLLLFFTYSQIFFIVSLIPLIGILPFFTGVKLGHFDTPGDNDRIGLLHSLRRVVHSRNLLLLTCIRLLFAVSYGFFATYFIIYAEDVLLFAPFLIAFLLGVRGITDMGLRIPVGKLVDKTSYKKLIFIGFSLMAAVYFILSFTTDFFLLLILMILLGVSLGLRVVSEWTMVAHHSEAGGRSVTAAYLSTMFNIGSGIGAILGGILATFVEIPVLFRIASAMIAFGLLLILLMQKNDPAVNRSIGGWGYKEEESIDEKDNNLSDGAAVE